MFRGFNLRLSGTPFDSECYKLGMSIHSNNKSAVQTVLDSFTTTTGELDAAKMQANWFPKIRADIFISHAHLDANMAISLAGWLKREFNLIAFIDSCAWGYSDHLLQLIDKKYCINENGTYNYEKRNRSTAHVHMMLTTALTMMIDNTECLFFLNTPSSISLTDSISGASTKSPWIYSELAITSLIRRKAPNEHRFSGKKGATLAKALLEDLSMLFPVELDHLTDLRIADINHWWTNRKQVTNPLDVLYSLYD